MWGIPKHPANERFFPEQNLERRALSAGAGVGMLALLFDRPRSEPAGWKSQSS
jgi:hypothetical protein